MGDVTWSPTYTALVAAIATANAYDQAQGNTLATALQGQGALYDALVTTKATTTQVETDYPGGGKTFTPVTTPYTYVFVTNYVAALDHLARMHRYLKATQAVPSAVSARRVLASTSVLTLTGTSDNLTSGVTYTVVVVSSGTGQVVSAGTVVVQINGGPKVTIPASGVATIAAVDTGITLNFSTAASASLDFGDTFVWTSAGVPPFAAASLSDTTLATYNAVVKQYNAVLGLFGTYFASTTGTDHIAAFASLQTAMTKADAYALVQALQAAVDYLAYLQASV